MPEQYTKPFRGIVYNKEKIGDIASCVCPPYDVVSDARSYYKRNKFNAIRLELPQSLPSMDKYNAAKHTMDEWLRKGVLEPDSKDAVYVNEQKFDAEGISFLRRGFIASTNLKGTASLHTKRREKRQKKIESVL